MKLILFLYFALSSYAETESLNFSTKEISELEIQNSTGDIRIAPNTKNQIEISLIKKKWGKRCSIKQEQTKGKLSFMVDDTSWILDHECRLDLVISAPDSLKMKLSSGTGNIRVVAHRGDIELKVGSGKIFVDGIYERLLAMSGSGDIEMNGSTKFLDLKAGSGDVSLNLKEQAQTGQLKVQVGSGDVHMILPPQLKILSETATGNGLVQNDFQNTLDSKLRIEAKSGSGDIQIRKR